MSDLQTYVEWNEISFEETSIWQINYVCTT
jgi:hypothetical protein